MKKKKTLHLSKKRKRKTNRISKQLNNIETDFRITVFNRKLGNKRQMFLTFFEKYYGVGFNKIVKRIIRPLGISINCKLKKFKRGFKNLLTIETLLEERFVWEKSYKAVKFQNITQKRSLLIFISYRHFLMMPVRGQRTKTHGKTRRIFHVC